MKKQVKLLSAVMAMTMLSGVATLNQTAKAEETEPTNVFTMAKGASVRVPDVTNADVTTNDNGLRFTAYMSKDNYNAEATYGTFIMPLEYYQANPVSAETLAENYYWKTGVDADGNDVYNTTETDGKKQIINVEAVAYLDEVDYNEDKATEEMYVMNGSVRHIKGDNLALEYIGVSYAKVGDTYTFAEQTTDNARSVVEVAQKALLNAANDEAFTANELGTTEQKVTAVDNAYTARYVTKYQEDNDGAYPTVEMNVRAYKDISSTSGYVAEDTIAKIEVPFTGYDATATGMAKTIDGYTYVSLKTEPVTVMFDGSSEEIKHYYDYTANDIVLWDGDENLADSTYGHTDVYSMNDVDPAAGRYFNGFEVEEMEIYSGNSAHYSPKSASYNGPVWKNGINVNTDTFSFVTYAPDSTIVTGVEIYGILSSTGKTGWAELPSFTIEQGYQKVTVTMPTKVLVMYSFALRLYGANEGRATYYFDNLCAIHEYGLEEGYMPTAFGYDKGARKLISASTGEGEYNPVATDKIEFTAPVLKSTEYFPDELNGKLAMYYVNDAETTTDTLLVPDGNKYTINIPADSTAKTYTIKAKVGETVIKEYVIRKGVQYTTFEYVNDATLTNDWAIINAYGTAGFNTSVSRGATIVTPKWYEYKIDSGAYIQKTVNGPDYISDRTRTNLPFSCKKIGFYISDATPRSPGHTINMSGWCVRSNTSWIYYSTPNFDITYNATYVEIELKSEITVFDHGTWYFVADQVNFDSIVFLA